jgi:hypothetical protein
MAGLPSQKGESKDEKKAQRTMPNLQTLCITLLVTGFLAGSSAVAYAGDFGGSSGLFGFRAWVSYPKIQTTPKAYQA